MAPTAEEWIAQFAEALGRPAPAAAEVTALLELASVAGRSPEEALALAATISEAAPPPGPDSPDR